MVGLLAHFLRRHTFCGGGFPGFLTLALADGAGGASAEGAAEADGAGGSTEAAAEAEGSGVTAGASGGAPQDRREAIPQNSSNQSGNEATISST